MWIQGSNSKEKISLINEWFNQNLKVWIIQKFYEDKDTVLNDRWHEWVILLGCLFVNLEDILVNIVIFGYYLVEEKLNKIISVRYELEDNLWII